MKTTFVSFAVFLTAFSLNAQDAITTVTKPERGEDALKNRQLYLREDGTLGIEKDEVSITLYKNGKSETFDKIAVQPEKEEYFSLKEEPQEQKSNLNAGVISPGKKEESQLAARIEDATRLDKNKPGLTDTVLRYLIWSDAYKNEVVKAPNRSVAKPAQHSKVKMSSGSCESKFYKIQALFNEGVSLYESAHKLADKASNMTRGKETCDLFRQSLKLLDRAAKKFKIAEKKVVGGIVACDAANAKSIIDMGEECRKNMKTIEEFKAAIKKEMVYTCR